MLHDRIATEIGIKELSPKAFAHRTEHMGRSQTIYGTHEINQVVERWITLKFTDALDPDQFIKRRLSFIELAFRTRGEQIDTENKKLANRLAEVDFQDKIHKIGMIIPGSRRDEIIAINTRINSEFFNQVNELNERFKQANLAIHYHNGYLQIIKDEKLEGQVEKPFWILVNNSKWQNVSIDMAEAIDRRDTKGRDPSFYAAKALESTIKIICEEMKFTNSNEKGVSDFLNHLESKSNGAFIASWERQSIQRFYSDVRNDLGHGPGSKKMPELTPQQTDQTIEFCMSWIKSLINRM